MLLIDQKFDTFSHLLLFWSTSHEVQGLSLFIHWSSEFCDSKKLNIDISNVLNRPNHITICTWNLNGLYLNFESKVQMTGRYNTLFVTFPIIWSFKHVIDMALLKFRS